MRDEDKSKAELISELNALRQKLAEQAMLDTEHKRVVEALRSSEERYRTLFESANDAIFVETLNDEIVDVNPRACMLTGYTREELLRMKVSDLQAPEIRGVAGNVIQQELAKHPEHPFESINLHKDGTRIYIDVSNARLGNTNLIFSIIRDRTRRMQAEARLRASEARWLFALEGAGDGIWDWNLSTNEVLFSRQWKAMLGYTEAEIGCTLDEWDSRVHPDDREMVYAKINEHLTGQAPIYSSEHRVRCKDGQYKWILDRGKIIQAGEDGAPLRMIGTHTDISEYRHMESRLRDSEEHYRLLVESAPDAIFVQTNGRFAFVNAEALKLAGAASADQLLGQMAEERFPPLQREAVRSRIQKLNEEHVPVPLLEEVFLRLDGSEVDVEASAVPIVFNGSHGALVFMRDITKRKQAEEQLHWSAEVNAALAALYKPLTAPGTTILEITREVLKQSRQLTQSQHGYVSEINPLTGQHIAVTLTEMLQGACAIREAERKVVFNPGPDGHYAGLWGYAMNNRQAFFTNTPTAHPSSIGTPDGHVQIERFLCVPVLLGEELVGQIALANSSRPYTERDVTAIQRVAEFYALAIQHRRNQLALQKANETLARAQEIAHLASWEYSPATGEMAWSSEMYQIMGFPPGSKVTIEDVRRCLPPEERDRIEQIMDSVFMNNTTFRTEFRFIRPDGQERFLHDEGAVICDEDRKPVRLHGTLLDITERHKAEQERLKQMERLEALHEIDRAVTTNMDLKITLDILLAQVIRQLKVDAADILTYDTATQMLTFACGRGFQNLKTERGSVPLSRSLAGQAILTRRRVMLNPRQQGAAHNNAGHPDSAPGKSGQNDRGLFTMEDFETYIALPILAKGQVKGVLEVFHRSSMVLEQDWLGYLDILAGQAAIAIENRQMLENLQRANTDLGLAYDTTIEGWSRALDLRDKETEGHSRRVMELTIRVARAMGIQNENLVHLYYGALLHDIGKMGVPDNILHKPDKLTPEEWEKMRQHPTLAFELLSPIPYLRRALEIPYCHHEKWDGSGYPRGLSGEQIPLPARIFAIVDVWDALLSDRPYRPAWPKEKAIDYIQTQSGKHFDPEVVEMFLDVIQDQES